MNKKNKTDMVNHPAHYTSSSGLEVVEVMEAFDLGRETSNAVKYILRAGKKENFEQDIEKAIWWLERCLQFRRHTHSPQLTLGLKGGTKR